MSNTNQPSNQPKPTGTLKSSRLGGRPLRPTTVPVVPDAPTAPDRQRPGPRKQIPRVPQGEHRPDPDPSPATRIDQPPAPTERTAAAAVGARVNVVKNVPLSSAADNDTASSTGEPSVATHGDVVFYTGNWYAALSTNGGDRFQFVDPFHSFPDPPGLEFCCDQVVHYMPQIDRFVWLLQYIGTQSTDAPNIQRLAFASPQDVARGQWATVDLHPADVGLPNAMFDFPDLAVGANSLYVTTNAFEGGQWVQSVIFRIPVASIQSGNVTADHAMTNEVFSFRVAQHAGTRAFFAAHLDTSTLRVFSWDEGQADPVFQDVPVALWSTDDFVSRTPDGFDWLGRTDPRVLGATTVGDELWFSWGSARGGANQRPQPFTQIARLRASDLSVLDNINLWDPNVAIAYAALCSNIDGAVGVTYMAGGEQLFPAHIVGLLAPAESHTTAGEGRHGPQEQRWGDYLTLRRHDPDGTLFAATGYTLLNGAGQRDGAPRFVLFGS
jgi:hypothetical protein